MPSLMDQRAEFYLETFQRDGSFDGGLSFPTALRQSRLDGSLDSLERIDYLLDRIRMRFHPAEQSFLRHRANQNFIYLLGFYIGDLIARESRYSLEWLGYEELLRWLPPGHRLPYCLASSIACVFAERAFFLPLSPILERLFSEEGHGVRSSSEKYLPQAALPSRKAALVI